MGDSGDEVGFGKFKFNNSRGVKYVIRATNGDLAETIADTATKLAENQNVGYDQSSSKHRDLWNSLKENGPERCVGDVSCSTVAMASLKYAMLNSKYKDVCDNYNYDWRSETIVKKVRAASEALDDKPCVVYSYSDVSDDLKRGDIMTTEKHTFVLL